MAKKSSTVGKKSSVPSKKSGGMNERRLRDEDFDEIDAFAQQREKVLLDSEDEAGYDEDLDFMDEEALMDLPDEEDFESALEAEDEEEEEEIDMKALKKEKVKSLKAKSAEKSKSKQGELNRLAAQAGDSDDDILYDRLHREGSDDEENAEAVWGKNRKNYYAEDDDAEAVEEVATEARRLQKKKLSAMKLDDFVDEDGQAVSSKKSSKKSLAKKKIQFDDLDEFEPVQAEEEEGVVAGISEEEIPEFVALLCDFQDRLKTLKTQLVPLLQRVQENKIPTSSGLSFLKLKYQLMLAYCSNVVYYLMMKGRGGRIEGHPVIERMIKYRLLLEKIRPLEIKMKYQIERLLQPAENAESKFRPNPEMMARDSGDEEIEADDDEKADGIYRAPKLAPVHYPEDGKSEGAKNRREEERMRKAAGKSRLLAELRGELEDLPEEESIDVVRMSSKAANDHKTIAQEAYEEENFVRFQVTKKEQRRQEKAAKPLDELDDLDEFFGELDEINKAAAGKETKKPMSKYLAQITNRVKRGADEDDDQEEAESVQKRPSKYMGSDESEIEEDSDDGEDMKVSRHDKKRARRQEKLSVKQQSRGPISHRPIADRDGSAPRPASYNIIKNRGLTPSRTKEQRNPRVRQRHRYEKAVKKMASFRGGRMQSDTSKPYSGESTGIRTNLSKSARFK